MNPGGAIQQKKGGGAKQQQKTLTHMLPSPSNPEASALPACLLSLYDLLSCWIL